MGATVFYVEEGDEREIAIPVGAFADSCFPAPTVSVYEARRRHPWVTLPDDVGRWRKDPVWSRTIGPTQVRECAGEQGS